MAMNEFTRLCVHTANGCVEMYSTEDANAAIRKKFYDILEVTPEDNRKTLRRAIRRHKLEIFELIEDTITLLLQTGWGENPFFKEFVEVRNIALGDKNGFVVEDDSMFTVSKFSGNHHDLIRQKLGAGESIDIPTSWYGFKESRAFAA